MNSEDGTDILKNVGIVKDHTFECVRTKNFIMIVICFFIYLFVHSFIRSLTHSFIHSVLSEWYLNKR